MMVPASRSTASRRAYVNAEIIAPAQGLRGKGGILIEDGWILAAGPKVTRDTAGAGTAIIDCAGLALVPGLIDMRVFTGEPGTEYRETLASASEAAAAGGVTTMIVMPNTQPVIDDAAIVDFIMRMFKTGGSQASPKIRPTFQRFVDTAQAGYQHFHHGNQDNCDFQLPTLAHRKRCP